MTYNVFGGTLNLALSIYICDQTQYRNRLSCIASDFLADRFSTFLTAHGLC